MTKNEKTITEMQSELDVYINQFEKGYFSPLVQLARLTEELGELAREINHTYGEKQKKETELPNSIKEELGDVLISTIIMANSFDINLAETFNENMNKFNQRDKYRFARKNEKN